jgi:hypothetical protein
LRKQELDKKFVRDGEFSSEGAVGTVYYKWGKMGMPVGHRFSGDRVLW